MSDPSIVIIGSLPPTPSNAAHLMDQLARNLTDNGYEVHCLIDTLGQTPIEPKPYTVHRFHELNDARLGILRDLPRLYVLGSGGDSLFAFEQMRKSPGAVIVADYSFLPIAPAVAAISNRDINDIAHWLESRYGDAGWTAAQAAYGYRRRSSAINREISAYGLVLGGSETVIALNPEQHDIMLRDGLQPKVLNPHIMAALLPNTPQTADAITVIVVGASTNTRKAVETELSGGTLKGKAHIRWRYAASHVTESDIANTDAVFHLGQQDAAASPLHIACVKSGKLILSAHQPWAAAYQIRQMPTLGDRPAAILHAVAALSQVDGLQDALIAHQTAVLAREADSGLDIEGLLEICTEASSGAQLYGADSKLEEVCLSTITGDIAAHKTSETTALIGCVPVPPILSALGAADSRSDHAKFMEYTALTALAHFMGIPKGLLPSRMGFEAPVLRWNPDQRDGAEPTNWTVFSNGLQAGQAIVWGLPANTVSAPDWVVHQGTAPSRTVSWVFQPPAQDLHLKPDQLETISGFDETTGLAWSYDPLRKIAKIAFMTGGAGQLSLSTTADETDSMVYVCGAKDVQTLVSGKVCESKIADHGLAMLELADIPSYDTVPASSHSLLQVLHEHGLHIHWNANA